VAENFAKEIVVSYLQCFFFPLEDNSDFIVKKRSLWNADILMQRR
jgi:hypothetical protein